jgi:hypothetical protein
MQKYRDPVPWRDVGQLAAALGVALVVYTMGVALAAEMGRLWAARGGR